MFWQLTTSYLEYLSQLSALLRDPVYYGTDVLKGKGESILLIPGFLAGDWTLMVMAGWLGRVGYRPYLVCLVDRPLLLFDGRQKE